MHIHEIIIDGFKSYATKTVVSGFDQHFNAITGLNGSGKSNILDAICFVLGLSNLSQVRVGNLQELVYKQGQAGVTKATATIVFDNSDPSTSPVGYEHHKQITITRQIVIGGKNKYMINGHTVQQNQVQNLLHSVQLNVNNPHFLIMQGRITKVLNMKPPEILSMIEEAAGTRMFETKKQAALKTIEKKQQKVEEITRIIDEDITPKIGQLRGERQSYLEWSSNNAEVERLERFCVASEYAAAEERVMNSEGSQQEMQAEMTTMQAQHDALLTENKEIDRKIEELDSRRESETEGTFQNLKVAEQDLSKQLVKINSTHTNQKESLQSESDALAALIKQQQTCQTALKAKQAELVNHTEAVSQKEKEIAAAENDVNTLRSKYQNACAGVADATDAELLSLPEQIAKWEKVQREAESQLQQENLRMNHSKEKLSDLKKSFKTQQAAHTSDLKELQLQKDKISTLQAQLDKLKFSPDDEPQLRATKANLSGEINQLQDRVATITAQIEARLNFSFTSPEKDFDRSRVKGVVAKLIRIPNRQHATALEVAAGGKLFQVVVDTEQTGKLLLQKGQLRKRVTILPLNKISNRTIDPNKVQLSKRMATSMGGKAYLALELVGHDDEVLRAMQYTFGSAIICDNGDIAKAIAFDNNIRCRTVTLDGDVYDPSGTVTGGSKNSIGALLTKLEEVSRMEDDLTAKKAQMQEIDRSLQQLEETATTYRTLSSQMDIATRTLKSCQEKMAGSSYSQVATEIETIESDMQKFDKEVAAPLTAAIANASAELKKLATAENGIKKQREKAMKDMESNVKSAQKRVSQIKTEMQALKSARDKCQAEIDILTEELTGLSEQINQSERSVNRMTEEIASLENQVTSKRAEYETAKKRVSDMQKELAQFAKEIKAFEASKEKNAKTAQNISLEVRKIAHKLEQWKKDTKEASKRLTELIKKYPWIQTEKAFFGQEGSDYDFANKNVKQCMDRLSQLKSSQDKLAKKINKKVMGMIDKAETENQELRRKKEVILNDKSKIEKVIEELDVKKTQALQTTWVKVNRDFGSIFSTLLPGTHAKLEPPEGCTVMDGLEVKVAFNNVWKDSLTELSGGQRSLLALSLILALLLFKPAPMYILDEVDAALDLSHTQNIGLMLRTHFSASQFIVVSLKEGMFNNANVIFRTKFVDGVSTVARNVAGGAQRAITAADEEDAPKTKRGKNSRPVPMPGAENSAVVY